MKFKSSLSKVVAQQLGALEGQIKAYAISTLTEIVETKLKDVCPPQSELLTIIRTLDNIQNIMTKYQRQVQKYTGLITRLDKAIETTTIAVNVLRNLPVPTAVAGVGVPIGLTNRYSEKLADLSDFLNNLNNDKQAIISIIRSSNVDLSKVQSTLSIAKSKADKCMQGQPISSSTSNLNNQLTNSNNSLSEDSIYTLNNGRQLKVEIRTIEDPSYPVNRRYAEAKNLDGVVLLRGEPSYSSDTNILIEEVLFKLENQLV